jgi:enolase-phosphatase E1
MQLRNRNVSSGSHKRKVKPDDDPAPTNPKAAKTQHKRRKHETTDDKTTMPIQIVLTDIEGTTTPITFVHDELFPYVLNEMETFLDKNWNKDECQKYVKDLEELVLEP